jgi:excisionase family DNA binding protein
METLLSVHQAAERLGVSFWTVYRMARSGQLPSIHLGRRRLFVEEDLEKLIRSRRTDPESGRPAGPSAREC